MIKDYSGKSKAQLEAEKKRLRAQLQARTKQGLSSPDMKANLKAINSLMGSSGGSTDTATPASTVDTDIADTNKILGAADTYGKGVVTDFESKYPNVFGHISTGTTTETRSYLDRLNQGAVDAGNYTALENESINGLRAGLGGYDSPEVQAMREAGSQEMDRNLQSALYNQMKVNAAKGVRGGAAGAFAADLGIGAQQAKGNLERDLIIKNADEVQKRKTAFADLIRGTEDARFGRKSTAESMYGNALGAEESNQAMRETYNLGQDTNSALYRSGLGSSAAGTYTGTFGGTQSTNQSSTQFDWTKKFLEDSQKKELEMLNKYGTRLSSGGSTAI